MTPFAGHNGMTAAERSYNVAHRRARNCVERLIGVLKGRFRCIGPDRLLRYSPVKCGLIINSCAVLHNILLDARFPIEAGIEIVIENEPNEIIVEMNDKIC